MKLYPSTGKSIGQLEYARVIGCFMCAIRRTRPYIYILLLLQLVNGVDMACNTSHIQGNVVHIIFKYLKR
jgi:hypothetical protein